MSGSRRVPLSYRHVGRAADMLGPLDPRCAVGVCVSLDGYAQDCGASLEVHGEGGPTGWTLLCPAALFD